jgi:hypothetical protein
MLFTITLALKPKESTLKQQYPFNKVIIWGHKLHAHTHSYVHYAFYKAFKYLGYDTYWFDNKDNVQNFDFTNSLFITETQVDQKIPLRPDCRYILHNCDQEIPLSDPESKYYEIYKENNCIRLQVYTHKCLKDNVKKIDDYIYYNFEGRIIYMPWATDLLPFEIEENKKLISTRKKTNTIYWVGTIGGQVFGNINQISPFMKACAENSIQFQHVTGVDSETNVQLIQNSLMAPTIVGEWQLKEGYIPCRIFKNISYGQFGITNSKTVYDLFERKIIYNENTYQLFFDANNKIKNLDITELYELMDIVKNKHTYINRISYLLQFLSMVKPILH